jgi:ribosomal protein S18 acetylase RimI-like enzyme
MSEIFAEGFIGWLGYFSKDKNKIAKAFAHMFVLDQFYVAVTENKIAGMVACTDCKTLSVRLNKIELRKYLGFYKGSIAAIVLRKEFESPFDNPSSETGSIEFVGTASEFRGKGVASQIISHIIRNTDYHEYLILEVADTNTPAMNLYKKIGFEEYNRIPIPQKRAKKIGINNFISLKYIKNNR